MNTSAIKTKQTKCCIAITLMCFNFSGQAQTTATTDSAAKDVQDDSVGGIERVVVTAQKRQQFLEKVPMSVSAITKDQLDKENVASIEDIGRITPGLSVHSTDVFGDPSISIRGISSNSGSATTAIYIDDAPIQVRSGNPVAGGTVFPQMFDLQRVEVLRGPQGTLFGSSAEGGLIRFITPTPSNQFTGNVKVGISTFDNGKLSEDEGAAIGGPINDSLSYRISIWHKNDAGYMNHVDRETGETLAKNTNSADATVSHISLLYKPNEILSIAPSVFFQDKNDADRAIYYVDAGVFNTYNHILQPLHDKFSLSSLPITVDLDSVTIKSITSYFDRHQNRIDDYSYAFGLAFDPHTELIPGLPNYVIKNNFLTNQNNLSQELRFSSNDTSGKWEWVGGIYASKAKQTQTQLIEQNTDQFVNAYFPGVTALQLFGEGNIGPGGIYSYVEKDNLIDQDVAIFGETTYKFTSATNMTVGLRKAKDSFNFTTDEDGPWAGGSLQLKGSQSQSILLPKFALNHDLNADDLVYFSAAKGSRVGGANPSYAKVPSCGGDLATLGLTDNPITYKSDYVWSYELGYKARMLNNRLELASSIYMVDWSNIQQSVLLPTCLFSYSDNLGSATSHGGDIQLQFKATNNLILSVSTAYTDAHYTETSYANGSGGPGILALATKGQSLPIPKINATLGAEYRWSPADGVSSFVRADHQYSGPYQRTGPEGTFGYDPLISQAASSSFTSFHSGVSKGKWTADFFINNLFNSQTELMRTHNGLNDPSIQAATFKPRMFGISVGYKL